MDVLDKEKLVEPNATTNEEIIKRKLDIKFGTEYKEKFNKTTIAKKIIKFFGCNDVVTSPTFNIVKNYEVGEIKIFHVDLYRLGSCSEFIDLDIPLNEENTLVVIEWANLMAEANIPIMDLIEINIVDEHTREIFINV